MTDNLEQAMEADGIIVRRKTLAEFINGHKSRAAAARALGVTPQTVARWIEGKFKPSPAQVELAGQKGVDLLRHVIPVPDTKA